MRSYFPVCNKTPDKPRNPVSSWGIKANSKMGSYLVRSFFTALFVCSIVSKMNLAYLALLQTQRRIETVLKWAKALGGRKVIRAWSGGFLSKAASAAFRTLLFREMSLPTLLSALVSSWCLPRGLKFLADDTWWFDSTISTQRHLCHGTIWHSWQLMPFCSRP